MATNKLLEFYHKWQRAQTPIVLPVTITIVGFAALILGDHASKSFATIGGDSTLRVMGVIMIVGGGLILSSFVKHNALREVFGLSIASLGTAIYSGGALIGLGAQGLITGIGYAGITLTLLSRVFFILQSANAHTKLDVKL